MKRTRNKGSPIQSLIKIRLTKRGKSFSYSVTKAMRNKWRPHNYGNKRFTNLTLLVDMMLNQYKKFTANENKRYTIKQIRQNKYITLWKSITDTQIAANHIENYFKTVMGTVTQYAVSYPYDKKYTLIGS